MPSSRYMEGPADRKLRRRLIWSRILMIAAAVGFAIVAIVALLPPS